MEQVVEDVTLATLGNGAAVELFETELFKVLDNIEDPNTKPDSVREITLKVSIKPNDRREKAIVAIQVKSKLAPVSPFGSMFFFGRKGGRLTVVESNPQEPPLPFDNIRKVGGEQ